MVAVDRRSILKALSISGFVALGSGSVMRQLLQGNSSSLSATPFAEDDAVAALPERAALVKPPVLTGPRTRVRSVQARKRVLEGAERQGAD